MNGLPSRYSCGKDGSVVDAEISEYSADAYDGVLSNLMQLRASAWYNIQTRYYCILESSFWFPKELVKIIVDHICDMTFYRVITWNASFTIDGVKPFLMGVQWISMLSSGILEPVILKQTATPTLTVWTRIRPFLQVKTLLEGEELKKLSANEFSKFTSILPLQLLPDVDTSPQKISRSLMIHARKLRVGICSILHVNDVYSSIYLPTRKEDGIGQVTSLKHITFDTVTHRRTFTCRCGMDASFTSPDRYIFPQSFDIYRLEIQLINLSSAIDVLNK